MAYVAIRPVEHDGKRYQPGEVIDGLADEAAAPLLELGAVVLGIEAAEAEPEPAPEPAAKSKRRGRR